MQPAILLEAFDGGDFLLADFADVCVAGTNRNTVEQDGASAALTFAAAVFRSGQLQVIAQNTEETSGAIRVDADAFAVHVDFSDPRHTTFATVLATTPSVANCHPNKVWAQDRKKRRALAHTQLFFLAPKPAICSHEQTFQKKKFARPPPPLPMG